VTSNELLVTRRLKVQSLISNSLLVTINLLLYSRGKGFLFVYAESSPDEEFKQLLRGKKESYDKYDKYKYKQKSTLKKNI
jgi:hypothetical protein